MTTDQIELVRASFAKIQPVQEEAAVLFYARLFERDPRLRALFSTDIREQGHKLMQILGYAVDGLDKPEVLVPILQDLGARHVEYGVVDGHYEVVGDALLWTLRKALKAEYSEEVNEAWTTVYGFIAQTMKTGASRKAGSSAN